MPLFVKNAMSAKGMLACCDAKKPLSKSSHLISNINLVKHCNVLKFFFIHYYIAIYYLFIKGTKPKNGVKCNC